MHSYIRVNCPADCLKDGMASVYGYEIYAMQSSICRAAIHLGVIENEDGGNFVMSYVRSLDSYQSRFSNEIMSLQTTESKGDKAFLLYKLEDRCPGKNEDSSFIDTGMKLRLRSKHD